MSNYQRDTCRLCQSKNLEVVLSLEPTPLCDAYVLAERLKEVQETYPLDLYLCRDCGYVHLTYVVDPENIYTDYLYVTTSSMGLADHFQLYSKEVLRRLNPISDSLIIDLGSNDGTLLSFFKKQGMRVLGIEPAREIATKTTNLGVETLPEFFTSEMADKIEEKYGFAKIITINNLFANIDDLDDTVEGVCKLLSPDGVFVMESSYLGDMIKNMVFDFIYHEHLSYFSVKPLLKFLDRFNMELIDVQRVPTKGGSLRYYIQKNGGPRAVSAFVDEMVVYENDHRLDLVETYETFSNEINARKSDLTNMISKLQKEGKTFAGFGGSATTTTLMYHFDLCDKIEYIVDDNPAKHNTYSPGCHIPVLSSEEIYERKPGYVIMFAWRYFEPITKKHQRFLDQGGHFIVPLPELEVI
ncbi:MAG: methyltransferase [Parcubacteria group bacterium]|nr:methyltransferase [Parcubacteria group bacterium]